MFGLLGKLGIARRPPLTQAEAQAAYIKRQKARGRYAFIHINKCGGTSIEEALGIPTAFHDTAVQRRDKVGQARWRKMFTFTVVRHPYEKVQSHYRYRLQTNQTNIRTDGIDLNTWVRQAYGERDRRFYNSLLMFSPCLDWIVDEQGKIIVDYVAKLETIEQDWRFVQDRLHKTIRLPHANRTTATAGEPLNDASKSIVNELFAKDFAAFGYKPD